MSVDCPAAEGRQVHPPPEQEIPKSTALWRLARLLITGTSLLMGSVLSSCGVIAVGVDLAAMPRGPEIQAVPATIVGVDVQRQEYTRRTRAHAIYAPVVRFAIGGKTHQITGPVYTRSESDWPVGARATVRVDPNRPQEATLAGWYGWKPALRDLLGGLVLLGAGTACWRRSWWLRPGLW